MFKHRAHVDDLILDLLFDAVKLAQQDRGGVGRIACAAEVVGRADGEVVHHLEPGGEDPLGDDRADRCARALHVGERREQDLRTGRLRKESHLDLDHYAEQTFRACHQSEQVVAGGVERAAADGDALAVGSDHDEFEDVVHGETVLQAVEPARIFCHVAADAARNLGRRIRGVVESERRDVLGNREIAHPGLHPRSAVDRIDLEDPVKLREAQQHPAGERQRAAREPRPRAPRDDRHAEARAGPHHLLHLLDRVGEHRDERDLPVRGEPVALVGLEVLLGVEHRRAGEEAAELSKQVALAGITSHGGHRLVHRVRLRAGVALCGNAGAVLRTPTDAAT